MFGVTACVREAVQKKKVSKKKNLQPVMWDFLAFCQVQLIFQITFFQENQNKVQWAVFCEHSLLQHIYILS